MAAGTRGVLTVQTSRTPIRFFPVECPQTKLQFRLALQNFFSAAKRVFQRLLLANGCLFNRPIECAGQFLPSDRDGHLSNNLQD